MQRIIGEHCINQNSEAKNCNNTIANIKFYRYNKDNKKSCITVEKVVGVLMMEKDQDNLEEPMIEGSDDEFSIDLEEEKDDFFQTRHLMNILAQSWTTQPVIKATRLPFQPHPQSTHPDTPLQHLPTHPTYLSHPLANSHHP